MRPNPILWIFLVLGIVFSFPAAAAQPDKDSPGPLLAAKPYRIAIAPPHITESPSVLFERPDDWKEVRSSVQVYKYYGVQMLKNDWVRSLDPKAFATMIKESH